jgi:RNA polymerase sigma factor (sigma-70 family)
LKRRLDRARDGLVLANLRLVVHVAKRFNGGGTPMPDLVQEGNIGLLKAVDRFDPRRGNRFSTYAYPWIRQAVERAICNQSRTVRLPVHVYTKSRTIRQASDTLWARQKRRPTEEEVARESGLELAVVRDIRRRTKSAEPLEDSTCTQDPLRRERDPQAVCPFEATLATQRRSAVEAALGKLTSQERQVIRLRYGLGRPVQPTLRDVGEKLDLSRERVRQIEKQALARIASSPDSEDLLDYAGVRRQREIEA